ncbi:PF13262 family protein [Leptospira santarosai str. CBC523]|nr:PF13262 family protein [Leptospira santarosai str. CBC523]
MVFYILMPEILLSEFKLSLSEDTFTDPKLTWFLNQAKRNVIRDGIQESHSDFDELQRLYALYLIQKYNRTQNSLDPNNSGGAIESLRVEGIAISYSNVEKNSNTSDTISSSSYLQEYQTLLSKSIGLNDRLA